MSNARVVPARFGPYLLVERLGFGGHGAAYLATDPERGVLPGTFVIKVLHDLEAQILIERFQHEAEILRYIQSPHVVRVFESGVIDGEPYLAMELAPGWRVSKCLDIIAASGSYPALSETIEVFSGGLRGLRAIHEARHPATGRPLEVVHRDITPKNLMVDQRRVMRIIDFGLGRSTTKGFDTRTGLLLGTPGYMAPEVVTGRAVDHRADLYALAVILWEWLTLQRYVPKGSLPEMLAASKAPRFVPPSRVVARPLPEALDEVLRTALEHEPNARFSGAQEMLSALQAVLDGDVTEAAVLPTRIYVPTEYERAPHSPSSLEPTSVTPPLEPSVTLPAERPSPNLLASRASPRLVIAAAFAVGLIGLLGLFGRSFDRLTDPGDPTPRRASSPPALRAAPALRAIAEPAKPEPAAQPAPRSEAETSQRPEPPSDRKRRPRLRASSMAAEAKVEPASTVEVEVPTVEGELASLRRRAAELAKTRPELADEVSALLDRAVMDAAIRDPAVSVGRVRAARRHLEALAGGHRAPNLSPGTSDSPR